MHLPKTGGTTLHNLLSIQFSEEEICTERHNKLDLVGRENLTNFNLYSGHYDFNSIKKFIPQPNKIITLLREPKSRLLSAYYFARSHKTEFLNLVPEYSDKPNCYKIHGMNYRAAKEKTLLDYLISEREHLNNQLIKWIGGRSVNEDEMFEMAVHNLNELFFIGIMDEMDLSIRILFSKLNYPIPASVPKYLDHNKLHEEYSHCEKIEKEEITSEIDDLLTEITYLDCRLFEIGKQKFSSFFESMVYKPDIRK